MNFAVHMFDVVKHIAQMGRSLAHGIGRDHAAGFHRSPDATGAGLAQQGHGKTALQQRLTAGKGQAAARAGVKGHILLHHTQHIAHSTLFTIYQQALCGANFGARDGTICTMAAVDARLVVIAASDCAMRASCQAMAAL